jgi:TolB-like protein
MKKFITLFPIALALCVVGCASGNAKTAASPEQNPDPDAVTLDRALSGIAGYFTGKLPKNSRLAITGFEADTEALSNYAVEELWNGFEDFGGFVIVDRQNVEKIRAEMNYQLSGEVSDESARAIGRQFGVRYIVYGRITRIGGDYRVAAYATDVETATSKRLYAERIATSKYCKSMWRGMCR